MAKLRKILVVDDSAAIRALNVELLESMEIAETIDVCGTGAEVISYLKGPEGGAPPVPEIIFLDIMMPEMDGLTFLEEYEMLDEKLTNNFQIVIAIVSDYLDFENFSRAKVFKSSGVVGHIRKPMDAEDVNDLIDEFILDL
ncbi:MAG: response regulator [Flavobacteriales bacterium]|nr:response regulator [Flavobacteriales bacterium]